MYSRDIRCSPCVSGLKKGHREQEKLRAHHIMLNSVSQLNSIVRFNIKSEPNLLSSSSKLYNVEIFQPYHSNLTFLNQYIKFLKHELCIAQIMYKRAVLSLFMRFNRFQRHVAECLILKVKIHFYLHRAYVVYQQSAQLIQHAAFLDD